MNYIFKKTFMFSLANLGDFNCYDLNNLEDVKELEKQKEYELLKIEEEIKMIGIATPKDIFQDNIEEDIVYMIKNKLENLLEEYHEISNELFILNKIINELEIEPKVKVVEVDT